MEAAVQTRVSAKCWSCGAEVPAGEPFCGACEHVQPPAKADYFAAFALPRKLNIDIAALEKQFYRFSRKLHPDVYARASEQEQKSSLAQSALLNDAYRTLKNPVERTKYLLTLEGVQLEDESKDAPANGAKGTPSKVPPDLLEEVFELNMQLEEMRMNQKMGEDDPQLRKDLTAAKEQFSAQLGAVDEEMREVWTAWDTALDREDEAGKAAAKDKLVALLQRRSYLRNLVRDVSETLGEAHG